LNDDTCYDHFSVRVYGRYFRSKAPPIDFLNQWLATHGLNKDVPDKYVRFDLGGELGRCQDVIDLFATQGYHNEPTSANASRQLGIGQQPHRTIADEIRCLLSGAFLNAKFWPYAFRHYLGLYNVTIHGERPMSPQENYSRKSPNLSFLRTFGCRVFAKPPTDHRPDKAVHDTRTGIFLGYAQTMKNILYYDLETKTIRHCNHVEFDEGMRDMRFKMTTTNDATFEMVCDAEDTIEEVQLCETVRRRVNPADKRLSVIAQMNDVKGDGKFDQTEKEIRDMYTKKRVSCGSRSLT
jgi:hypothetical protein